MATDSADFFYYTTAHLFSFELHRLHLIYERAYSFCYFPVSSKNAKKQFVQNIYLNEQNLI